MVLAVECDGNILSKNVMWRRSECHQKRYFNCSERRSKKVIFKQRSPINLRIMKPNKNIVFRKVRSDFTMARPGRFVLRQANCICQCWKCLEKLNIRFYCACCEVILKKITLSLIYYNFNLISVGSSASFGGLFHNLLLYIEMSYLYVILPDRDLDNKLSLKGIAQNFI